MTESGCCDELIRLLHSTVKSLGKHDRADGKITTRPAANGKATPTTNEMCDACERGSHYFEPVILDSAVCKHDDFPKAATPAQFHDGRRIRGLFTLKTVLQTSHINSHIPH